MGKFNDLHPRSSA